MKNIRLILPLLLVLIYSCSKAQDLKTAIGINGGPSVVTLWGNSYLKTNAAYRFSGAGIIELRTGLGDRMALVIGLGYDSKGYKTNIDGIGTTQFNAASVTSRGFSYYNYITLPILLQYTMPQYANIYVLGGPYIAYLLKQTTENDDIAGGTSNRTNDTSSDNKLDAGIVFGLGRMFQLNDNTSLSFEVRDNLGLYNTADVQVANDYIRTQEVNFNIGLHYTIK